MRGLHSASSLNTSLLESLLPPSSGPQSGRGGGSLLQDCPAQEEIGPGHQRRSQQEEDQEEGGEEGGEEGERDLGQ